MISYDTDEFEKKAANYCFYDSVARYGPQSVAKRKWLINYSTSKQLPNKMDVRRKLSANYKKRKQRKRESPN